MKLIFLALLLMSTVSFANTTDIKPELARFDVNCIGSSDSAQGTLDAKMQGTISVFSQDQTGQLKLGSIGIFEFIADFKFHLNRKNDGLVTFSFRNANGLVLSKNSLPLPRSGVVATSAYYFDTASGVSVSVQCSVNPTAGY